MKISRILAVGLVFASITANAGDIIIYEASGINPISGLGDSKGHLVLINGKKAGNLWKRFAISNDSYNADQSIRLVRDYFEIEFGRDSYDGRGSDIEAITRMGRAIDLFGLKQNAAWDGTKFLFGSGDKDGLNGFTKAIDVIGHEYTHAVIQTTAELDHDGQSGALDEHLADVFGQYIEVKSESGRNDFLIGESVMTPEIKATAAKKYGFTPEALRDMLNPERGLEPQPNEMRRIPKDYGENCYPSESNDQCGVHLLSGIPNRAIALAVLEIGWDKVVHVVYDVMTERLAKNAQFSDYAREVRNECSRQLSSSDCAAIDNAFKTVGL